MIHWGWMMEPPHQCLVPFSRNSTCHGHEFGLAMSPPTTRFWREWWISSCRRLPHFGKSLQRKRSFYWVTIERKLIRDKENRVFVWRRTVRLLTEHWYTKMKFKYKSIFPQDWFSRVFFKCLMFPWTCTDDYCLACHQLSYFSTSLELSYPVINSSTPKISLAILLTIWLMIP